MLEIPMRTFPGLFVGRRTVIRAEEAPMGEGGVAFRCGACEEVVMTAADRTVLKDVVVKCRCGEFNQV